MTGHKDYRASRLLALSWEVLHRDARALAAKITARGMRFKGIVAITRGGLAPAAVLARELDIRRIETLCIASYDGKLQGAPQVLNKPRRQGHGWLVVDDLVDSGTTIRIARQLLPQALFATIYAKPEGQPLVDVYAVDIDQEAWIVFPWDEGAEGEE
jgi:xanthine phosphoribosyltransferase